MVVPSFVSRATTPDDQRESGTLGGEAGKLPVQLPFLRLLLWEAAQELEGLGQIWEDKGYVCTQPQV